MIQKLKLLHDTIFEVFKFKSKKTKYLLRQPLLTTWQLNGKWLDVYDYTLFQNDVFWLVDERGILFTNS
jgi:hypothetical protein